MLYFNQISLSFLYLFLRLISTINTTTKNDIFGYPPEFSGTENWKLTFNDGDVVDIFFSTSVGNPAIELVCCSAELCQILFRAANAFGGSPGRYTCNLTLTYGPVQNCKVRIDQPTRGNEQGFESGYFNIAPASTSGFSTIRTQNQNITFRSSLDTGTGTSNSSQTNGPAVSSNETGTSNSSQAQGTAASGTDSRSKPKGDFLSPSLSLNTDGDASQFPEECLDSSVGKNGTCWEALNLNAWVKSWVRENVPCAARGRCSKSAPTIPPWTKSFLKAAGQSNLDCYYVGSQFCSLERYLAPGVALNAETRLLYARYSYVVYNIYRIWGFFQSWQDATYAAIDSATGQVDVMARISFIDVKAKHNWAADIVSTALSVSVALIPGVAETAPLVKVLVSKAINAVAGAVPGASKALWPTDPTPDNQRQYAADDLKSLINRPDEYCVKSAFTQNINLSLATVQGVEFEGSTDDFSLFLQYTKGGLFSDDQDTIDFNKDNSATVSSLKFGMNTFVLSTLLAQNGYSVLLLPGVDPTGLFQSAASCPAWAQGRCDDDRDLGCNGQVDVYGMCKNTWYSTAHKSSYTLLKQGGTDVSQATDIMHGVIDTGVLADGVSAFKNLFEYTAICSLRNVFPNGSNPVYGNLDSNGDGFFYNAQSFPGAAISSIQVNATTNFLRIAPSTGEGFVGTSKDPETYQSIRHPTDAFYVTPDTFGNLDYYCLSQMNVSVANYWAGQTVDDWTKSTP